METIGKSCCKSSDVNSVDLSNCPALKTIDSSAFQSCTSGHSINVDGTNNIEKIEEFAFRTFGAKATEVELMANFVVPKLTTLGNYAFGGEGSSSGCKPIASFNASGAPIETIGEGVFWGCSIKSIDFSNCQNLTTVGSKMCGTSDKTCVNLTTLSFANCPKLENTSTNGYYQCNALTSADFTGCTSLKTVNPDTFFECKNVVITGVEDWPVETIGQAAFNMCQAQPTLKFTNSKLTTVNNQAFRGCNSCSEIELHFDPDAETAVYHQAFTGCGANTGGCDIKLYCDDTMPNVTPIGDDETSGTGSATWRISFGTNSGTTFHFPAAAEANAKSTAQLLEDDTKTKCNDTTPTTGNIAWWCCSNGGLTTTTGGSDGAQEAHVNLWYTGTPTLAFDL